MRKIATEDMVRAIPGNDWELTCDEGFVRYIDRGEDTDGEPMAFVAVTRGKTWEDGWFPVAALELVS